MKRDLSRINDSQIGNLAVCKRGRIGLIQRWHQSKRYHRPVFKGINLEGNPWQSMAPAMLDEEDAYRLKHLFEQYL